MTTRKKPKRHVVKAHQKRKGTQVRSHLRGSGTVGRKVKKERILSTKEQEKLIQKIFPEAKGKKGWVEYSEDYGQIELAASDEVSNQFKERMEDAGYKVKKTDYTRTGGYRQIATKPGRIPVVDLEW